FVVEGIGNDVPAGFPDTKTFDYQVLASLGARGKSDLGRLAMNQLGEHLLDFSHEMSVLELISSGIRTVSERMQIFFNRPSAMRPYGVFGRRIQVGLVRGPREIRTGGRDIRPGGGRRGGDAGRAGNEPTAVHFHARTPLHGIGDIPTLTRIAGRNVHAPFRGL